MCLGFEVNNVEIGSGFGGRRPVFSVFWRANLEI
jgi:hypothetical protein